MVPRSKTQFKKHKKTSRVEINMKHNEAVRKQIYEAIKQASELQIEMMRRKLEKQHEVSHHMDVPSLTHDMVTAFKEDYEKDSLNDIRTNTISNIGVEDSTLDREKIKSLNYSYSHTMPRFSRATSQHNSGRCWIFAALNTIRSLMINHYNLPYDFEISESYVFFWDKIERSYNYLISLMKMRHKESSDPVLQHILTNNSPNSDGGNWAQVASLIMKYGLVPKTVYNESMNTVYSSEMNQLLHDRLMVFYHWIRKSKLDDEHLISIIIKKMMPDIFQLVSNCMGKPILDDDTFTWEYYESGSKHGSGETGRYHRVENLTPTSFYQRFVEPLYKIDEMVYITDDPRNITGKTYTTQHSCMFVGAMPDITFNVGIDELKRAVALSIMDQNPVWFTCDVGKDFDPYTSILSDSIYKRSEYFEQELQVSKKDALDSFGSYPTHAMCFVGLNTVGNDPDKVDKWRVENSWGEFTLEDPGYIQMHTDWFDRYVFGAVVNINYLPPELQAKYNESKYSPVKIPYNDPSGSVAVI
jgi:bleomycin hydrolase